MTTLILSIVMTWFGIGGAVLAFAAVALLIMAPTIGLRAAPVLAVVVALCLALGYVERLQDDVASLTARSEKAEAEAVHLAAVAQGNADAAKALAADNAAQAQAYAADFIRARSDADRIEIGRRAAKLAASACASPNRDRRRVSEDDGLAPSMGAAMDALRARGSKP